tara:strand:+ start:818 stop:1201 length:384 start_codon:yes stop_codon:yes gene_type:complete
MNEALLKKMGVSKDQVKKVTPTATKSKTIADLPSVKKARSTMNTEFKKCAKFISAQYLKPIPERDNNNKIVKKDGKSVIKEYEPTSLKGEYILTDNKDGTQTATKLHVFKEEFIVCGETISITEISS